MKITHPLRLALANKKWYITPVGRALDLNVVPRRHARPLRGLQVAAGDQQRRECPGRVVVHDVGRLAPSERTQNVAVFGVPGGVVPDRALPVVRAEAGQGKVGEKFEDLCACVSKDKLNGEVENVFWLVFMVKRLLFGGVFKTRLTNSSPAAPTLLCRPWVVAR